MTAGWCVRVSVFDDLVVSISERELAGRDLSEADKELIRDCARHLLSFVGEKRAAPAAHQERTEPLIEAHTRAVGDFLSELYAIMVDPCAEGTITVDELKAALVKAALRDREAENARQPFDYVKRLQDAKRIVRESCLWKRFIDGTPLENDLAVWMTDFAAESVEGAPARAAEQGRAEPDKIAAEESSNDVENMEGHRGAQSGRSVPAPASDVGGNRRSDAGAGLDCGRARAVGDDRAAPETSARRTEPEAVLARDPAERVAAPARAAEWQPLTKNEIETLRNAIRPLDCGHHYCRYCDAGTHNQWQHSANCPYGLSVTDVDAAKAILEKLLPPCALTGTKEK